MLQGIGAVFHTMGACVRAAHTYFMLTTHKASSIGPTQPTDPTTLSPDKLTDPQLTFSERTL